MLQFIRFHKNKTNNQSMKYDILNCIGFLPTYRSKIILDVIALILHKKGITFWRQGGFPRYMTIRLQKISLKSV